jgi:hypothetical protein
MWFHLSGLCPLMFRDATLSVALVLFGGWLLFGILFWVLGVRRVFLSLGLVPCVDVWGTWCGLGVLLALEAGGPLPVLGDGVTCDWDGISAVCWLVVCMPVGSWCAMTLVTNFQTDSNPAQAPTESCQSKVTDRDDT